VPGEPKPAVRAAGFFYSTDPFSKPQFTQRFERLHLNGLKGCLQRGQGQYFVTIYITNEPMAHIKSTAKNIFSGGKNLNISSSHTTKGHPTNQRNAMKFARRYDFQQSA
jgi:hypothetical protein